jgi:PAS domain S-box-containing protein
VVKRRKVDVASPAAPTSSSFKQFLDAAPDAIVIADHTGRIAYVNRQTERLLGFTTAELVGQALDALLPGSQRDGYDQNYAEHLRTADLQPSSQPVELFVRSKNGAEIPVEVNLSAVKSDGGIFILSTFRDLRNRQRLEAERGRPRQEDHRVVRRDQPRASSYRRLPTALRALADAIPVGVIISGPTGEILLSNAIANKLLGGSITGTAYGPTSRYTLHQMDGSPFPPGDLPLPRAIEKGVTTRDVMLIVRYADGAERIILAAATPERDAHGQIIGAIAVIQDVTEREKSAQALREREERLRLITNNSPDVMFGQDLSLRYEWIVNPAPPLTEGAVVGKTESDIYPPDLAVRLTKLKHEVIATGSGARTTLELTSDIGRRVFEAIVEPRRDREGRVVGIIGYARDVTDRIAAEEDRARLERNIALDRAQLTAIFESVINPIIYVDAHSDHVRTNPQAEKLFGHSMRPEAGRDQFARQLHYPDGREILKSALGSSQALQGEVVQQMEMLIVRPDGTRVPAIENAAPVKLPSGEVSGAVVIIQDISALKELERLREEWTSIVAHDLRQPITVILGYAGLLAEAIAQAPPRLRLPVDHILDSARLMRRMVQDLLDASRIETRRLSLECQSVDLTALVPVVVERARELTRGNVVSVTVNGSIPLISGDPSRIEQVLTNLLTNAAKYGERRSDIEVLVDALTDAVRVGVRNRGQGIAPMELASIFDRFARTRSAQRAPTEGLGLGLYIAKGLIEAHGGQIWVESTPGETTTFWFTLPLGPHG